jgi:hypothetical protein
LVNSKNKAEVSPETLSTRGKYCIILFRAISRSFFFNNFSRHSLCSHKIVC